MESLDEHLPVDIERLGLGHEFVLKSKTGQLGCVRVRLVLKLVQLLIIVILHLIDLLFESCDFLLPKRVPFFLEETRVIGHVDLGYFILEVDLLQLCDMLFETPDSFLLVDNSLLILTGLLLLNYLD